MNHAQSEVSLLIHQVKQGDESAKEKLFFLLHAELRDLAGLLMRRERPDHTLQATALVNEACIRLLSSDALTSASDRKYLFGAANRAMRQVLIDHSRRKRAPKRGGDHLRTSLDVVLENFESSNHCRFEDLDAALEKLEIDSKRQREVVELRFFSGLSLLEVAEVLEVSLGTVQRDWRLARAKLMQLLDRNADT